MFKKILLAILICCMMISIIPTTTLAAQPEIIQPMWTNATSFTTNMFFSGSTGTFTVYVFGKTGVTNISLNVQLYYKNASGSWVKTNESWQYSANQMYLSVTDTFDAVRGREYKIEVTGTVTKGGVVEEIDGSKIAVCPAN